MPLALEDVQLFIAGKNLMEKKSGAEEGTRSTPIFANL